MQCLPFISLVNYNIKYQAFALIIYNTGGRYSDGHNNPTEAQYKINTSKIAYIIDITY